MARKMADKKGMSKKGKMHYEDPEEMMNKEMMNKEMMNKKMMGKKKPQKAKK